MRSKGLVLVAMAVVLVTGCAVVGAEDSLMQLKRANKALLIPAAEVGEVSVSAHAEPTQSDARRYRYSYTLFYREGIPSVQPYSDTSWSGPVPIVGVDVMGDPDCDYTTAGTPSRRQYGPWSWGVWTPGTISFDTTGRRWKPAECEPVTFTFTSSCAPGEGAIQIRLTHEEDGESGFGLSGGIMVPGNPQIRTTTTREPRPPAAPQGRSYAQPTRRR